MSAKVVGGDVLLVEALTCIGSAVSVTPIMVPRKLKQAQMRLWLHREAQKKGVHMLYVIEWPLPAHLRPWLWENPEESIQTVALHCHVGLLPSCKYGLLIRSSAGPD